MKILFALLLALNFNAPTNPAYIAMDVSPVATQKTPIDSTENKPVKSTGTILFFKEKNGVGMIRYSSEKEVPFYASDTETEFKSGTKVSFDWKKDLKRGERALNIEEIED